MALIINMEWNKGNDVICLLHVHLFHLSNGISHVGLWLFFCIRMLCVFVINHDVVIELVSNIWLLFEQVWQMEFMASSLLQDMPNGKPYD